MNILEEVFKGNIVVGEDKKERNMIGWLLRRIK